MSMPTTLLGFCRARRVAGYYLAGAQGTIPGIAFDLSALPYFLRLFPGPYRAGVPGRLVPVGSICTSRRGAVSRGSAHSRSEKRVGVGSGVLARRFGRRGHPEAAWNRKRALFFFRSERRAGVGNGRRSSSARPSGWRFGSPFPACRLGFWAGPGVACRSQRCLLGQAFAGKQVHEGP